MCWYCEHIREKEIGVAVDIHHVESKSKSPHLVNEISNMFAICRKHHEDYKVIFRDKETLKNIVKEKSPVEL